MTGAGTADAIRCLAAACDAVRQAREQLTTLDAAAGDGDLGESLVIGFTAVEQALRDAPADPGDLLVLVGRTLGKAAPSTLGTLLGMGLRDVGKAWSGTGSLTGEDLVTGLDTLAEGISRRGGARAGQRTVLDAILASREDAAAAVARGDDVGAVLAAVAGGARRGAEATASMTAQLGRAGWIPERAEGIPDAGASAWAVIATGLASACQP